MTNSESGPDAGSRRSRRRWLPWAALALAVFVAGAATGVFLLAGDDSSAGAVTLVPANGAGPDPFTESVSTARAQEFPTAVRAVNDSFRAGLKVDGGGLVAVGTAPGLYGGSGDAHVCDPAKLVAYLRANAAKADAWARALGVPRGGIDAYVAKLTPVVLTTDTLVTNHGYRNGRATSFPAVLQAGTAVMVDATGTPRVKCNCGNPLTPPQTIDLRGATLTGQRWATYTPGRVVVVAPAKAATELTLVDVRTGTRLVEPVGGGSGVWVATQIDAPGPGRTQLLTSADGATWTDGASVDGAVRGLAYGDGRWIALSVPNGGVDTVVLESTDLLEWRRVGNVPDPLSSIAYGEGHWVATGTHTTPGLLETSIARSAPVVYRSSDGRRWQEGGTSELQGGSNGWVPPVAFGAGRFVLIGLTESFVAGGFDAIVQTSTDGAHWTPTGGTPVVDGEAGLAHGADTWVLASSSRAGSIQTSTDTRTWTAGSLPGVTPTSVVAFGGGRFLAPVGFAQLTDVFSSRDGTTWTRVGSADGAGFSALAFGAGRSGAPPAASTSSTTTTTVSSASASTCSDATRSALQDAYSHDPEDDRDVAIVHAKRLQCAGDWAVADTYNQGIVDWTVFHRDGGTWSIRQFTGGTISCFTNSPDSYGPCPAGYLAPGQTTGPQPTVGVLCDDPTYPAALKRTTCT